MLKMPFTLSRKKPEPTEPMSLESKKVVLREKRIEDALDDYTWRVDDELAKLDATRPLNMAYNDFLRYSQEEIDFPSSRSKRFGIDDLTGKHIGNCMYYDIDTRRHETELGIMIWRSRVLEQGLRHRRRGHAVEVYLHADEYEARLSAHARLEPARAEVLRKSGFRQIKQVRKRGLDFIQMEILRPEWEEIYGSNGN